MEKYKAKLVEYATKYADGVEWLANCPFQDGQPFYETAGEVLEFYGEEIAEKAHILFHHYKIEAAGKLLDEIRSVLEDGPSENDEAMFWRDVAKRAAAL